MGEIMNRRKFLQYMGASTALSVGGIALLDTRKTFFLPPKGGWQVQRWHNGHPDMSHIRQYIITEDFMPSREDVLYSYRLDTNGWGDGRLQKGDVVFIEERILPLRANG